MFKTIKKMEIYEFRSISGNYKDWVYANDIDQAKDFYVKETGDDLNHKIITIVPRHKWDQVYITDPDEAEPYDDEDYNEEEYCNGYKIVETFSDYVKRTKTPGMIATTFF